MRSSCGKVFVRRVSSDSSLRRLRTSPPPQTDQGSSIHQASASPLSMDLFLRAFNSELLLEQDVREHRRLGQPPDGAAQRALLGELVPALFMAVGQPTAVEHRARCDDHVYCAQQVVQLFTSSCKDARFHWGKAGWSSFWPCFDGAITYPDTWCHFGCAVEVSSPYRLPVNLYSCRQRDSNRHFTSTP